MSEKHDLFDNSNDPGRIEMENYSPEIDRFVRIRVVGVGGGGSNAVSRMVDSGLRGVDFIIVNSDAQALTASKVGIRSR